MTRNKLIKINFRGGIISPDFLSRIVNSLSRAGIREVRFGLRQQMFIEANEIAHNTLRKDFEKAGIPFQWGADSIPNIISSYPAQDIFMANNWLSEGVYKDIFDALDYEPRLKINISDMGQSFTPFFTGNINWVASSHPHYWHLFIRFPKTNIIYEWDQLVYTNDVSRLTRLLENSILTAKDLFYGEESINIESLFGFLATERFILKPAEKKAVLPVFNLPYYEGLNRYNNKNWLGIYQRNETFSTELLRDICRLCQETKLSELCTTPWKSLIIKGIEEKDRMRWSQLLDTYSVNIRHAANELNFQVEDHCAEGLDLKNELVQYLNRYDIRTFGISIGIKTRRKSEIFCNILIRKRYLIDWGIWKVFAVYDILCAKDFNPNERTGSVFSSGNPRFLLPEQLRRAVLSFYKQKPGEAIECKKQKNSIPSSSVAEPEPVPLYQCPHCLTLYDEQAGEPERAIPAGTSFMALPDDYCCPLCEAPKDEFKETDFTQLGLQAI